MTIARSHVRSGTLKLRKPKLRPGLTLTELLVSVTIMILLVGAAIPILKPLNASTKNREAARQLQALLAEARGMAALRGRSVGVMFDTSLDPKIATDVQDRDAVTRCYLAEVPPQFQGLTSGSCVVISNPRTPADPNPEPLPPQVAQGYSRTDGGNPFAYLTFFQTPVDAFNVFNNQGGTAVDTAIDQLILPGKTFYIRFSGTGPWYYGMREPGTRVVNPTATTPATSARYRIEMAGQITLDRPDPLTLISLRMPIDINGLPYTTGTPVRPTLGFPPPPFPPSLPVTSLTYQIRLPAQRVGTSALELPSGAVVDLRCSGFGRTGYGLGQSLPAKIVGQPEQQQNPILLFAPNGSIDNFNGIKPTAPLHLLVGTRKQMAKLTSPALINGERATDPATGTLTNNTAYGNLRDGSSVWVTINNRTGAAATSDTGVIPQSLNLAGNREFNPDGSPNPINAELVRLNAILSAREFANSLNSRGGL